ncbi:MAG: hypothetical protein KDK91_05720 [Gammaproteobacteria bacterium]|nr:hypothetical protein [Gammaproteobacteria bacterium]
MQPLPALPSRSNPIVRRLLSAAVMLTALAGSGCALPPDAIAPAYSTTYSYRSFDCQSIDVEIEWLNQRLLAVSQKQQLHAARDAAALGAGFFFWPALFLLQDGDRSEELGRLKGAFDALEQVAIEKDCPVAAHIARARAMQRERALSPLPLPEAVSTDHARDRLPPTPGGENSAARSPTGTPSNGTGGDVLAGLRSGLDTLLGGPRVAVAPGAPPERR